MFFNNIIFVINLNYYFIWARIEIDRQFYKELNVSRDIKKTIRFSFDEYKIIESKLKDNNLDFTSFARKALLNQKIKFPLEKEILYELNTISMHLELIARSDNNYKDNKKRKSLFLSLLRIEQKLGEIL